MDDETHFRIGRNVFDGDKTRGFRCSECEGVVYSPFNSEIKVGRTVYHDDKPYTTIDVIDYRFCPVCGVPVR